MPATLTRDDIYSLWSQAPDGWHHMATDSDEARLQLQAQSLKRLFTNRRFIVVPGISAPKY